MYIIIQCQQQCLAMQQIIYLKRLMSDNIRLDMEMRNVQHTPESPLNQ